MSDAKIESRKGKEIWADICSMMDSFQLSIQTARTEDAIIEARRLSDLFTEMANGLENDGIPEGKP